MAEYKLSNEAREDLIRIHQYGVEKFGMAQADKYYYSFFKYFDIIAQQPFSFHSSQQIISEMGIDAVLVALIVSITELPMTLLK